MNLKNIVIAVSLDEATQKPFQYLKDMPIPLDSQIHLIHMATETLYATGMDLTVIAYPSEEEKPKIKAEVTKNLQQLKNDIFPNHTRVSIDVIFDSNIRAAFTDFVVKEKADLVVVATRGRHGVKALFDSSFAQYQLKHSPVNVLVLR